MTLIEIQKALYKDKPKASFLHLRKIGAIEILVYGLYFPPISGDETQPNLFFEIPISELMDGLFGNTVEAQLLVRYIVQPVIS